jgi:hypothetical protein
MSVGIIVDLFGDGKIIPQLEEVNIFSHVFILLLFFCTFYGSWLSINFLV